MARARAPKEPVRVPYSYRVVLSCRHAWLIPRPLPALGSTVECRQCKDTAIVIVVDERELEVYCPDCDKVIDTLHVLATLSANTRASVHNVRERKGHHAIVREAGNYIERALDTD